MSLHQALQMESTVRNCAGIPQYILILAELLEYNEWDNIDIKKEIPHWLRKDAKALKCSTQTPYDSLNLKDKKHAQPQRKKGFNESNRGDSFKHPSENPSVTPDQIRYRESKRAKKRREKKIKKITAKNDNTNSPFISKNAKKKLRPIQEEEEIERGKSPEKARHQFVEVQQMEDHGVEEVTVGYKPILKKKFTGSDGVEADQDQEGLKKSQSFVIKDQQSIDPVMKKHLSFNFEPSKHVGLHKKSKTKSKTKEYQEKKKEKLKRDKKKDFIPLRDSQVNEFFFVNPIVDKNKDDFVVDPSPYPEFELLEPDLRKKRFSVKIPAKSTSFGTGNTRRKSRTNQSGALTIKVEKLDDAIMEDKSNEEKSENDYEDNQSDKDYEFLFEPSNQQEAARKRVKSFRKSSSNRLQSNHRLSLIQEKDEIDPYLQMESDDNIFEVAKESFKSKPMDAQTLHDLFEDSEEEIKVPPEIFPNDCKRYCTDVSTPQTAKIIVDPRYRRGTAPAMSQSRNMEINKKGNDEDLLDSALEKSNYEFKNKKNSLNPFFCSEDAIEKGSLSDSYMEESSLIANSEDHEGKFKKGQGNFQKSNKSGKSGSSSFKKKGAKSGKKAKQFHKATKKKYNPHGSKDNAK